MFGRSHLQQEWSTTTHIFQFHPGFLNFLHNQQLPVNNYISKTSVWFQLLLLQKLSWSPALNEARNKKPREPSTRRTELDGLVSPAVALHLETTGPLCADLFMWVRHSLTKTLPFSFTLNPGLTFHLRSAVFRRTTPQWTDRVAKLHRTTITTTIMMMMMMRTTAPPGDVCFVRIPVGQAYSEQPGPEHEPAHRSDVAKGCRSSALRPHRPPSSL